MDTPQLPAILEPLAEPKMYWSLLVAVVSAFVISVGVQRTRWRLMSCLAIPIILAGIAYGVHIFDSGEAGGWALLFFLYLLIAALLACLTGSAAGYIVCRLRTSK